MDYQNQFLEENNIRESGTASTSSSFNNRYAPSEFSGSDPRMNNFMMPHSDIYGARTQWGTTDNGGFVRTNMAPMTPGLRLNSHIASPQSPMMRMPFLNRPQSYTRHLSHCTLFRPPAPAPSLFIHEGFEGCRTVFVEGWPENISIEIISEVFAECGIICDIKMTRRNCCEIMFLSDQHAKQAISLNGCYIKIRNNEFPHFDGRLVVGYVTSRENSLMQQTRQGENHADREEIRIPVEFSESLVNSVKENLQNEDTFPNACKILNEWLKEGKCNETNAEDFFFMIESTFRYAEKLKGEKNLIKNELSRKCISNQVQFTDIKSVHRWALMHQVRDFFSNRQRRFMENCYRNIECSIAECLEDDLELSEEEEDTSESLANSSNALINRLVEEKRKLQEEAVLLRNEIASLRGESQNFTTARRVSSVFQNEVNTVLERNATSDGLPLTSANFSEDLN